ncbi:MAG: hypothetical protein C0597_10320 [Marinilabiliales bacterium]|nr:MAG: hypothetical protein C0597_10320 [Marinilabiliales bacterium]
MIRNYLIVTIRNLFKNKLFSLINVLGLATGMAGALLVFLYIQYETGYEKFFTNYDNIYRLARIYNIGEGVSTNPSTPYGLAPTVIENIPSVENSTKYFSRQTTTKFGDKTFKEYVCYTDSLFFKIFDFEFIYGKAENAIKNPDEIVIKESIAKKYFGDENPLDKTLLFDDSKTFKVAGVIKDPPSNTHFDDAIFAPISDFNDGFPDDEWYNNYFNTYVLLNKNSLLEETENGITELYLKKMDLDDRETKIILQDLQEQHFAQSQLSKQNIYLFLAIGIFILILACINYMNLNTAKYIKRTKEIGIRKIVGAHRFQLIRQFFGETILLSLIAVFFGILLVETVLPYFNQISGMHTDINYFSSSFLLIIISIVIFSSVLAGSYPSLFLSSFKAVSILKGDLGKLTTSSNIRKILVIFQFTITTILIISICFIYLQFKYMKNKDLGFSKDNLIYVSLNNNLEKNYEVFKSSLLSNPRIKGVTKTSFLPMNIYGLINNLNWEDRMNQEKTAIAFQCVEPDHLQTIDYKLIEGRFLSEDFSNGIIVAHKFLGFLVDNYRY